MVRGVAAGTMLLGAHMSIAGGVDKAVIRGGSIGCTAIQIFLKNNIRWIGKPIPVEQQNAFFSLLTSYRIKAVVAHSCYLINLGSSDKGILQRSTNSIVDELRRAEFLNVPYIVIHPGSHGGSGESRALSQIARAINTAFSRTRSCRSGLLIETTSGQGSSVGYCFEHLAAIIDQVKDKRRIGVCFDTCHVLASGYDIRTRQGYTATLKKFETILGLDRLKVFHLNDSTTPLGSRRDRHAHIGKGYVGLEAFRMIMNDTRFTSVPKVLETPKRNGLEGDVQNLKVVRGLVKKKRS